MSLRSKVFCSGIFVTVVLALLNPGSSAGQQTLRFAYPKIQNTSIADAAQQFSDNLAKRLGFKVEYVPPAQLQPKDYLSALQKGDVSLALVFTNYFDGMADQPIGVFNQPYLFTSYDQLRAYQQDPAAGTAFTSLSSLGVLGLAYWNTTFSYLVSHNPVQSVADLRGSKIATFGPDQTVGVLRQLGAVPIQRDYNDALNSLRAGAVDTIELAWNRPKDIWKGENATVSKVPFRAEVGAVLVNRAYWRGLSEQMRYEIAFAAQQAGQFSDTKEKERQRQGFDAAANVGMQLASVDQSAGAKFTAASRTAAPIASQYYFPTRYARPSESRNRLTKRPQPAEILDWSSVGTDPCPLASSETSSLLYITSRAREASATDGRSMYGVRRALASSYGSAGFFLKNERAVGRESGDVFRLQSMAPTDSYVDFVAELEKRLGCSRKGDALIYIHGFNNTLEDGIRRAALLADELKYTGVPLAFIWPTDGHAKDYGSDRDSAIYAAGQFRSLLESLSGVPVLKNVHLVSHSMGSRVVVLGLDRIALRRSEGDRPFLANSIFGAAEIDRDLFRQHLPAAQTVTGRITLYASKGDVALRAARLVNNARPRAGDLAGGGIFVAEGLDSIDVSSISNCPICLEHRYMTQLDPMFNDLYGLIVDNKPPSDRRRLIEVKNNGLSFWRFR